MNSRQGRSVWILPAQNQVAPVRRYLLEKTSAAGAGPPEITAEHPCESPFPGQSTLLRCWHSWPEPAGACLHTALIFGGGPSSQVQSHQVAILFPDDGGDAAKTRAFSHAHRVREIRVPGYPPAFRLSSVELPAPFRLTAFSRGILGIKDRGGQLDRCLLPVRGWIPGSSLLISPDRFPGVRFVQLQEAARRHDKTGFPSLSTTDRTSIDVHPFPGAGNRNHPS